MQLDQDSIASLFKLIRLGATIIHVIVFIDEGTTSNFHFYSETSSVVTISFQ